MKPDNTARNARIAELILAGNSYAATARMLGLTPDAVRSAAHRAGIKPSPACVNVSRSILPERDAEPVSSPRSPRLAPHLLEERNKRILAMIRSGRNYADTARELGVSREVVKKTCIRAGVRSTAKPFSSSWLRRKPDAIGILKRAERVSNAARGGKFGRDVREVLTRPQPSAPQSIKGWHPDFYPESLSLRRLLGLP